MLASPVRRSTAESEFSPPLFFSLAAPAGAPTGLLYHLTHRSCVVGSSTGSVTSRLDSTPPPGNALTRVSAASLPLAR
jgi:hypothetical protein